MTKSRAGDLGLCLAASGFLAGGYVLDLIALYFPAIALLTWRTHLRLKDENTQNFSWGTLLLIAVAFLLPPDLTDDYHRYLWEGFVQNQGYSPYSHAPESLYETLDHPSEGKVNNADLTAIYPPLTQYLFRIVDMAGGSIYAWKLLILLCLLPLFKISREHFWPVMAMPLLLVEGLWNVHVDILGILPGFVMVLWLKHQKPWQTGLALAVLIAVKIIPIIFVPLCFMHFQGKDRLRFLAATFLLLACVYAPFLGEGEALFASFIAFSKAWYFNNPIFHALGWLLDKEMARLILTAALMLSLIAIFFIPRQTQWKLVAAWIAVIICSPTFHPWYLLWLIPLVPRQSLKHLNIAYAATFLAYTILIRYRVDGAWIESPWWMIPEWLVLLYVLFSMKKCEADA